MGAFGIDAEERRRETDAMNRRQGIEAMMSRPKRDAFAMYRTPAKSQALPVTAEPAAAASLTAQQVVVGRPSQKGGLRAVSVDGVLVGHAQKVPSEHASWVGAWAFKALDLDDLEFFDSLGDVRAHAATVKV